MSTGEGAAVAVWLGSLPTAWWIAARHGLRPIWALLAAVMGGWLAVAVYAICLAWPPFAILSLRRGHYDRDR